MTSAAVAHERRRRRAARRRLPIRTASRGAVVVTLVRPLTWLLGLAGFLAGGGLAAAQRGRSSCCPRRRGSRTPSAAPSARSSFGTPSPAMVAADRRQRLAGARPARRRPVVGRLGRAPPDRAAARGGGRTRACSSRPTSTAHPGRCASPSSARSRCCRSSPCCIVAWQPLYDAAYHELVLPDDLATPLGLRVLGRRAVGRRGRPGRLGSRATPPRRSACGGSSIGRRPVLVAWLLGWIDLVRRPVRVIATAVVRDRRADAARRCRRWPPRPPAGPASATS